MSRCRACDCILSDYELTRKSAVTGEYYDLCSYCFERIDLKDNSDEHEVYDDDGLTDWK